MDALQVTPLYQSASLTEDLNVSLQTVAFGESNDSLNHISTSSVTSSSASFSEPVPTPQFQAIAPTALPSHEIVFVAGNLQDYQQLVASLGTNREVFVLDAHQDGLQQITNILGQERNVSAVHLLSHGAAGLLQLGASSLNVNNIIDYASYLQSWSDSLTTDADILLYGCDVAADAIGQSFVQQLSLLTGADIAASTDRTGSLGESNWSLEFATGAIESQKFSLADYLHTLGTIALQDNTLTFADSSSSGENNNLIVTVSGDGKNLQIQDTQNDLLIGTNPDSAITRINNQTISIAFYKPALLGLSESPLFTNLTIQAGKGNDLVSFNSNLALSGGNLTVAAKQIVVSQNVKIDTRKTNAGLLDSNLPGDITFTGQEIQINSGAELNAGIGRGSGSIRLSASDAKKDVTDSETVETTAKITLDSAILSGGDIKISAEASSKNRFLDADNAVTAGLSALGLDLNGVFAASRQASATATVLVGGTSRIDAHNADLSALALVDTAANPLGVAVGVAYGRANATAKVTVASGAKINTGNALNITSTTQTFLNVGAVTNPVGPNPGPVAFTLAIAQANIESTAEVQNGATLAVSGDLTIKAINQKKLSTKAQGGAYQDGSAALSLAISDITSKTNAWMDGQATLTGGNALIRAESGLDEKEPTNSTTAEAGAGGNSLVNTIVGVAGAAVDKIKNWKNKQSPSQDARSGSNQQSLGVAAAWSQASYTDETTARVGDNATVRVDSGKLDLQAIQQDVPKIGATGAVNSDKLDKAGGNTKDNSISAAVAIGKFNHTVKAYIGTGATVDVYQSLNVTSRLNLPNNLIGQSWTSGLTWVDDVKTFGNNLKDLVLGSAFTSKAQSTAVGEKTAVAGSVNSFEMNNVNQAYIAANAKINQGIRSDRLTQTVQVSANTEIRTLNLAGLTNPLALLTVASGSRPGTAGAGVSYLGVAYNNNTQAVIYSGVQLSANQLDVNAKTDILNISVAVSGGKAGKFGANLTFDKAAFNNTTLAQIAGNAQITVNGGNDLSKGNVNLRATDELKQWNASGGVTLGQNVGIGGAASVNEITRNTQAIIGQEAELTTGNKLQISGGNLNLSATNSGAIVAISLAGAVASGDTPDGSGENGDQGTGKFGVAISGDASLNTVNDTTQALIKNARIDANTTNVGRLMGLSANNTTNIWAIAGSASLSTASNASVGIAGAYTQNTVQGTTAAYIEASRLNLPDTFSTSLTAKNDQTLQAIAAGGSGAPSSKGVAIAGSVAINTMTMNTLAYAKDSTLKSRDVALNAMNGAKITAIAGALGAGGAAGIGAALAKNQISNTTTSYVESSYINSTGAVSLDAQNTSTILSISAALAASYRGASAAIAVSLNNITNTTESKILNSFASNAQSNGVTAKGAISVSATDASTIRAIAGNGAAGIIGAAVGGAYAQNTVSNTVRAYANRSLVEAEQSVRFTATAKTEIRTGAVGVAASAGAAIGGGIAVNTINNTVTAYAQGLGRDSSDALFSSIKGKEIGLQAQDTSKIVSVAGQGAAGSGAGVGAAAAYNEINNVVTAYALNITLEGRDANASVTLDAKSTATIETLAASGGISGGTGLAGSIAVNNMKNTVESYLANSTVKTPGALNVLATNTNAVTVTGGSVTVSGGSGLGGSVVVNVMDNPTKVRITDSILQIGQAIQMAATSQDSVDAKTVSGSAAGGVALTGAISINLIQGETTALITGNTAINQAAEDAGKGGDITVSAKDTTTIKAMTGAAAASIGGSFGAGFDISDIRKTTTAGIDATAQVRTAGAVTVFANSNRTIDSLAVAGAAAAGFGVSGGVSILNLGAPILSQKTTIENRDGSEKEIETTDTLGETDRKVDEILTKSPAKANVTSVFNAASVVPNGTTAYINGTVNAGKHINVIAEATANATTLAGAAAIGKVGVGGAVVVANINNLADASVGQNATLTANGITIRSNATVNNGDQKLTAVTGSGGFVGLGAAVSVVKVNNSALSTVKDNAKINSSGDLRVLADTVGNLDVRGWGAQVGAAAGGIVWVDASLGGLTQAAIGNGVQVDTTSSLDMNATSKNNVKTDAVSAAGGIAALTGARSTATATPNVRAFIGNNSRLTSGGNIDIYAKGLGTVIAESKGITIGGITTGSSQSNASWTPTIETSIGTDTTLTSQRSIQIGALDNYTDANTPDLNHKVIATVKPPINANLLGIVGSQSNVIITASTKTNIGDRAQIKANADLTVLAKSRNVPDAKAAADSDSWIASKGIARIDVEHRNFTTTATGTSVVLEAGGNLTLLSDSDNGSGNFLLEATGNTSGLISSAESTIKYVFGNHTNTTVGASNRITAGQTLALDALNRINARTNIEQRVAGSWSGNTTARNIFEIDSSTIQEIKQNSQLKGDAIRLRAEYTEVDLYNRAFTQSRGNRNTSEAFFDKINVSSNVKVAQGVIIEATGEVKLSAKQCNVTVLADAFATKTGIIEERIARTQINSKFEATVQTAEGSKIMAGILDVRANNDKIDYTRKLPESSKAQKETLRNSGSTSRSSSINFNSEVTLKPSLYSLNITTNGGITQNGISAASKFYTAASGEILEFGTLVTGLEHRSLMTFDATYLFGKPVVRIAPKVEITNASQGKLYIDNLDLTKPDQFYSFSGFGPTFSPMFYVTPEVTIRNTASDTVIQKINALPSNGQYSSDLTFAAPGGTVRIDNPGGSIVARTSDPLIRPKIAAQTIELTARDSIGYIDLDTMSTQGSNASIALKSGKNIAAQVNSYQRYTSYTSMDADLFIEGGGYLNLTLLNAQQQFRFGESSPIQTRYTFKKLQVGGAQSVWKGDRVITSGL